MKALLPYVYTGVALIPVIIGLYKKKYSLLWLYTLAGFISNLLVAVIFYNKGERFIVANSYIIIEFILLFFFYKQQLTKRYLPILLLTIPLLLIGIVHIFYKPDTGFLVEHFKQFDSFSAALLAFSYIVYGIMGFVKIIREKSFIYLERSGFFWANTAIFIYTSGVFFLLLFTRYLINNNMYSYVGQLWNINDVLLILKSIMLSVSFYCKRD